MTKRAKIRNAQISKGISKLAAGFTIIETMLFLAIAGLIFAGLVAGTNGTIRQQRYKDSVQGFVDDLRDLYSLAENTQVLDYGSGTATCGTSDTTDSHTGRGRSKCSVYGIYAIISPTHEGRDNVQAYWVTGLDQAKITGATSDIDFLGPDIGTADNQKRARVSINTVIDGDVKNIVARQHSILWGADIRIPCASHAAHGCIGAVGNELSDDRNQVALFIYHSPITGSINTLTYLESNDATNTKSSIASEGIFDIGTKLGGKIGSIKYLDLFQHKDISFCVTGGAGMGYGGGIRMVTIDGNGSNSNAVRLIEADSDENKCNK